MKKKINWNRTGVLIAIIFFVLSGLMWLFQTFIYSKLPDLKALVLVKEQLFTINDEFTGLSVYYNDIELDKKSKDISIIKIRFINDGNESILPHDYDPNIDWGFNIIYGQILNKPTIVFSTDSTYFKSNYVIKFCNNDSVCFNKLIIDKDNYFDIKFYILHDKDKTPQFNTFGKIANISKIQIVNNLHKESPWWIKVLLLLISGIIGYFSEKILHLDRIIFRKEMKKFDEIYEKLKEAEIQLNKPTSNN